MPQLERIVFFGTSDFAVPTLRALCEAEHAPILVVSQPGRPAGRHQRLQDPPVAVEAHRLGLELRQPEAVKRREFLAHLETLAPDLAVVVAFGQIFTERLLAIPPLGCVNLHGSLLPRHRGAAPIHAAIASGDASSGVTTMLMERGLDSGPVLLHREVEIGPHETGGELSARLSHLGGELVVETLEALAAGSVMPVPQDDDLATYAPRLTRADGRVDWQRSAVDLERLMRAYTPWPGTFTPFGGESVKLLAAEVVATEVVAGRTAAAGEVLAVGDDALVVACGGGGALALTRLQRPGRRPVSGSEFANGVRLEIGARLG